MYRVPQVLVGVPGFSLPRVITVRYRIRLTARVALPTAMPTALFALSPLGRGVLAGVVAGLGAALLVVVELVGGLAGVGAVSAPTRLIAMARLGRSFLVFPPRLVLVVEAELVMLARFVSSPLASVSRSLATVRRLLVCRVRLVALVVALSFALLPPWVVRVVASRRVQWLISVRISASIAGTGRFPCLHRVVASSGLLVVVTVEAPKSLVLFLWTSCFAT